MTTKLTAVTALTDGSTLVAYARQNSERAKHAAQKAMKLWDCDPWYVVVRSDEARFHRRLRSPETAYRLAALSHALSDLLVDDADEASL
jgi:hypothetical protein